MVPISHKIKLSFFPVLNSKYFIKGFLQEKNPDDLLQNSICLDFDDEPRCENKSGEKLKRNKTHFGTICFCASGALSFK
jgi:hypothetical protein